MIAWPQSVETSNCKSSRNWIFQGLSISSYARIVNTFSIVMSHSCVCYYDIDCCRWYFRSVMEIVIGRRPERSSKIRIRKSVFDFNQLRIDSTTLGTLVFKYNRAVTLATPVQSNIERCKVQNLDRRRLTVIGSSHKFVLFSCDTCFWQNLKYICKLL